MAVVVIVTLNYLSGEFTARAPLAVAIVWLIAAIWGYTDWWFRCARRHKSRNKTAPERSLGTYHTDPVNRV